jgi:hypothetical protein
LNHAPHFNPPSTLWVPCGQIIRARTLWRARPIITLWEVRRVQVVEVNGPGADNIGDQRHPIRQIGGSIDDDRLPVGAGQIESKLVSFKTEEPVVGDNLRRGIGEVERDHRVGDAANGGPMPIVFNFAF